MSLANSQAQQVSGSAAERAVRVNLAACYRLAAHFGWTELVYTHITARVPGTHDQFLINPFGLTFDEITASSLVKVDVDGKILEPTPYRVQEAGFVIHSAVHMARSDVECVFHNHTRAGMAVSMLDEGLLPLSQHAMMFHGKLAYHESEGFAIDFAERQRIAVDLGQKKVLMLRNHGPLVAAESVAEAFSMMFMLEKAMQAQLDAMATGGRLHYPPQGTAEQISGYVYQPGTSAQALPDTVEWPAMLRLLDRISPGYAE